MQVIKGVCILDVIPRYGFVVAYVIAVFQDVWLLVIDIWIFRYEIDRAGGINASSDESWFWLPPSADVGASAVFDV